MQKFTKAALLLLLVLPFCSMAQTHRTCATNQHHQWLMQTNPEYARAYQQREKFIDKWTQHHANDLNRSNSVPDTIPVVVHVVWKTAAQNVSDAQVQSQIDVLNEDFGRMNADTVNTPAVWKPIGGSLPYRFVLARRDPSGIATNGIVRVQTTTTTFSTNDAVKFNSQGGSDSWDVTTYLNIWVCNLGGSLLGYGEFPNGTPSNTYGFVCNYTAFGTIGTAQSPFDGGRTTTHEIGHCFNLAHIWGDDGTACTGSDLVADTPNQADENYFCPTFPSVSCSNGPNGDMFMNYMDYTDDACMNIFTVGQATRMTTALNAYYPTIINSIGLQPPSSNVTDAGISVITAPSGTLCSATISPVVTIRNFGATNLTSATINYQVDALAINTQAWTGNLAPGATSNVALPVIPVSAGAHTFTSYTTNPNGVADQNAGNDSNTSNFNTVASGAATPYAQGFEAGTFPPTGWSVTNPDAAITWASTTAAFHSGASSMWIDNANNNATGETDDMDTQPMDLTTVNNPELSFWMAYKLWTNPTASPNFSDTLDVLISTDCGVTFTNIFRKFGVALTTTTPTWQGSDFTPTAAEWRKETISLAAYATNDNVVFRFRNTTDYENNLFIDDINIDQALAVEEIKNDPSFSVYPVPSKGVVNMRWSSMANENISLVITNAIGEAVYASNLKNYNGSEVKIDLGKTAAGVYNVKVQSATKVVNQKIILNR